MVLLDTILRKAIEPALAQLPPKMASDAARVMLLTIRLQESRFMCRAQKTENPYGKGPARGFWQNERAGGVQGVLTNSVTRDLAREVCRARGVSVDSALVHARLEYDDVLAATIARLILWADPKPLPSVDASHDEAWDRYIRCRRPGNIARSGTTSMPRRGLKK